MSTDKTLTKEAMLRYYRETSPKDLINVFEGLADKLYDLGDIKRDPGIMFQPETLGAVIDYTMESYEPIIEGIDYGEDTQLMESFSDDMDSVVMPLGDVHKANLRQIMENSAADTRTMNPNQFNLNQLTPFDAFLPFTIIRSYLPLIGKDLVPTQTPAQPFIRIKQQYKYIVTKEDKRYMRPDVYNDTDQSQVILDSARGAEVTQAWFPEGTLVESEDGHDYEVDGKKYKCPEKLVVKNLDLLEKSGGLRAVGDALDIDIHVKSIRAIVKNSDDEDIVVEQTGYAAYPDITSISPQRSISFKVKIPVKKDGKVESIVEDQIYGDYNAATASFNLVSLYGYVKQVQFGGHMSNKNNMEYFSFTNEFGVEEHPIPEGYSSNVPITIEDMQLYNESASIDIVATAVNEMTEIFTQLEDGSIINKIDKEYNTWVGKGQDEHPFQHMFGPVVFTKEVDLTHDTTRLLKRNELVQDEIQYAVSRFIGEMRNTLKAEPFRLVAFAHPNICSLFVGDNVDWKITPGSTGTEGIRTDYRMGVYTADGNSFRIISSMKIKEADGIRFLLYPVNEQNFLSWKHFKYSMFFSRDYRNPDMSLVPNVKGMSRFYTHSYTPLQAKLIIRNY